MAVRMDTEVRKDETACARFAVAWAGHV